MSNLAINGVLTPPALTPAVNKPVLNKTDEKTNKVSQRFFAALIKFISFLIVAATLPLSIPLLCLSGKVKDFLFSSKDKTKQQELSLATRNQETAIIPRPFQIVDASQEQIEENNTHPQVLEEIAPAIQTLDESQEQIEENNTHPQVLEEITPAIQTLDESQEQIEENNTHSQVLEENTSSSQTSNSVFHYHACIGALVTGVVLGLGHNIDKIVGLLSYVGYGSFIANQAI
jgi:hypothetical protein